MACAARWVEASARGSALDTDMPAIAKFGALPARRKTGPAAFLTLILGGIVTVLAIWLDLKVGPPWWVHALLWIPLTIGGVVGSLRLAKGMLLALEYRNAAREGKIDPRP